MPSRPLKLRELLQKLKRYGITTMTRTRGKGSEIILLKPVEHGSRKGPQFPIKNHGDATEIHGPVIKALLRRFDIDEDQFWMN
jgi:hypothetical protein